MLLLEEWETSGARSLSIAGNSAASTHQAEQQAASAGGAGR